MTKPYTRRLTGLLLCILLLLAAVPCALAAETESAPARYAGDAEELYNLLAEDAGGVIYATGDIVYNYSDFSPGAWNLYVQKPVTVDMGPYSFILETGYAIFSGPVHITGSGTVVQYVSDNFLATDDQVQITAVGDGATALYIDVQWGAWYPSFTQVTADGENAVAVDIYGDCDLETAFIQAYGAGSTGLRATGDVTVFLCDIAAEGEAIAAGGDIELDCSLVSPAPAQYSEQTRTAMQWPDPDYPPTTYITAVGFPPDEAAIRYEDMYFYHDPNNWEQENEGETLRWADIPVTWNMAGVDLDTPGEYTITGEVDTALAERFPMVEWRPLTALVQVLENPVRILSAEPTGDSERNTDRDSPLIPILLEVTLAAPLQAGDEVTVQYREADGAEWHTIPPQDVDITGYGMDLHGFWYDESAGISTYYYVLRITVLRDGETLVSGDFDFEIGDEKGGDRNDTDREGGGGSSSTSDGGASSSSNGNGGASDSTAGSSSTSTTNPGGTSATSHNDAPTSTAAAGPTGNTTSRTASQSRGAASGQPVYGQAGAEAQDGGETLTYTAAELAVLLAANQTEVTFIGGGLRLAVPTAALATVELAEGETLRLQLGSEAGSFWFYLYAGQNRITAFPGSLFTALLPASLAQGLGEGTLYCTGPGERLAVAREDGALVVQPAQTGRYTLQGEAVETAPAPVDAGGDTPATPPDGTAYTEESNSPGLPLLPLALAGAGLLLCGGGALLWRRRRKGRPA